MPDADVEPEPCWDCMTPIPPGFGLCEDCLGLRGHHPSDWTEFAPEGF